MSAPSIDARALVRRLYEHVANQDLAAFRAALADDVVLVEAAGHPHPGRWQGPEAVMAALAALLGAIGYRKVELKQIFVDGRDAIGLVAITSRNAAGEELEMTIAELWRFDEEGRVTLIAPHYHDTKTLSAHMAKGSPERA